MSGSVLFPERVALVVTISESKTGERFYRVELNIGGHRLATFDRNRDAALGRVMQAGRRYVRELAREREAANENGPPG